MLYDSIKTYDVGIKPHPRFPQSTKNKSVQTIA